MPRVLSESAPMTSAASAAAPTAAGSVIQIEAAS
jgi:hypothetical protein